MRKKVYKSAVYGLQYRQYLKILNEKVRQAKEYKGYEAFRKDIMILKKTRKNEKGFPAFLADAWMKRVCDMDKEKLKRFVNKYQEGDFNPHNPPIKGIYRDFDKYASDYEIKR